MQKATAIAFWAEEATQCTCFFWPEKVQTLPCSCARQHFRDKPAWWCIPDCSQVCSKTRELTMVTGTPLRIQRRKVRGVPARSARVAVTRFAEAPTRVAFPPKHAPKLSAQASVCGGRAGGSAVRVRPHAAGGQVGGWARRPRQSATAVHGRRQRRLHCATAPIMSPHEAWPGAPVWWSMQA